MHKLLEPLIPEFVRRARRRSYLERLGTRHGISVRFAEEFIEIYRGSSVLRLGLGQEVYSEGCISDFDYYFDSVTPLKMQGRYLADFSTPRFHRIAGFDHFPILIPTIPEPYVTVEQYLSFARLKPGGIVFDLGAYAGITSIAFSQTVGAEGAVFGFEADRINFEAASENLETARRFGIPANTTLIQKAVWCHGNGLEFSSEGAMGSSAVSIVGKGRGQIVTVPTTTLADFCAEQGIGRVDFIKMDIEGAEIEVLESSRQLLSQLRPRLVIEPHYANGELTTARCCELLQSIGYKTEVVVQHGVSLPLIEASPQ
jgi:FkbM family methyltransferase